MAIINIRIDDKTKVKAVKILDNMGLDMTSAIKMFLRQVVREKHYPFSPTFEQIKRLEEKWARDDKEANGKRWIFDTAKEAIDHALNGEDDD